MGTFAFRFRWVKDLLVPERSFQIHQTSVDFSFLTMHRVAYSVVTTVVLMMAICCAEVSAAPAPSSSTGGFVKSIFDFANILQTSFQSIRDNLKNDIKNGLDEARLRLTFTVRSEKKTWEEARS